MSTSDAEPATSSAGTAEHADGSGTERQAPVTFRAVPLVGLVAVGFFALCLSPIAFQANWWFLLFLVPVAVAAVVVRTRTVVDADALRVHAPLRSRTVPWDEVATLRVAERGWVRAVGTGGGETPLVGIRTRDVARVGAASGGRIAVPGPEEAQAAAEHQRELEATRMRLARLREQRAAESAAEGAAGSDTEPTDTDTDATDSPERDPADDAGASAESDGTRSTGA